MSATFWEEKRAEILGSVREVIQNESDALGKIARSVDDSFFQALSLIASSAGKVIVTGVGKSGLVGRKIASTLCSTGTMAAFLHPTEAMHGDLGLVGPGDVIIAIGKSGESEELKELLPALKRLDTKIIAITAVRDSTLGRAADVILFAPVDKEACPLDLAPTTSTTVALAIGDALAATLMKMKDFKSDDFARYHPGGKLGKRLLLRVQDMMIPRAKCAVLDLQKCSIEDVISALGTYGQGLVVFASGDGKLEGILTDGDIRRLLSTHKSKIFDLKLKDVMNSKPLSIEPGFMAVEALKFMEDRKRPLNVVPVVEGGKFLGIVRLHELLSVS